MVEKEELLNTVIMTFANSCNYDIDKITEVAKVFGIVLKKIELKKALSEEEESIVLQKISEDVYTGLKEHKGKNKTGAKMASAFCVAAKLFGDKTVGFCDAMSTIFIGEKECVDNYKMLLEGLKVTRDNRTLENFRTLLEQYVKTIRYDYNLGDVFDGISERVLADKHDFKSPIEEEKQKEMKPLRQDIVTLSKKYKTVVDI